MNKYVVAFLNLSDGEILQEIVESDSAYEAGMSYLHWWDKTEEGWEERPKTLKELYEQVYNADCYINVLDLNKALSTGRPGGGLQPRISQFNSESRLQ